MLSRRGLGFDSPLAAPISAAMRNKTREQISAHMRSIRKKDTKPELIVRRLVHRSGYRYRLHRTDLPGTPDLVFPGRRKVIFIHGCFWHQHACKLGSKQPMTNRHYWLPKLARNLERDAAAPLPPNGARRIYAVSPVPGYPGYFIGKDNESHACLLIAVTDRNGRPHAPIRLESLEVQFEVLSLIKAGGETVEGTFTVLRCRSAEPENCHTARHLSVLASMQISSVCRTPRRQCNTCVPTQASSAKDQVWTFSPRRHRRHGGPHTKLARLIACSGYDAPCPRSADSHRFASKGRLSRCSTDA
jgi:DNA mismatch endonuclease Vsr